MDNASTSMQAFEKMEAKAEKITAEKIKAEKIMATVWELSEREREIIRGIGE